MCTSDNWVIVFVCGYPTATLLTLSLLLQPDANHSNWWRNQPNKPFMDVKLLFEICFVVMCFGKIAILAGNMKHAVEINIFVNGVTVKSKKTQELLHV